MASLPHLSLLVLSDIFVLLLGGSLTILSYKAYIRIGKVSLRYVTIGFALITASAIAEVMTVPVIAGGGSATNPQLLTAYAVESLMIGLGLATIYYGLKQN